ncbi:MAG: CARDB domain-containing protein, partial [Kiritimatiellia bacterium]
KVTVKNVGTTASTGGTLYFFASQPTWAAPADADNADESVTVGPMAPGEDEMTFTVTLTAPVVEGWYHARGYLIPNEADLNTGNNQAAVMYNVAPAPDPDSDPDPDPAAPTDLAVTAVEFVGPKPTVTGEAFTLKVTVKNVGSVNSTGGALHFYASNPTWATPANPGTPDKTVVVDALAIGAEQAYEATLTTPAARGWHQARGYLIPNESEWNTGNNQAAIGYGISAINLTHEIVNGTMELKWNNYWGDTYIVYRRASLGGEFTPLATVPSARPEEFNTYVDEDPSSPAFYKIGIAP